MLPCHAIVVRPAGIEPARLAAGDFLTASAFAAGLRRSWSGLYLHHSSRRRCPPSSLYTFPQEPARFVCRAGSWELGSVLAVKPSPNLTGSTPSVSRRALKLIQVSYVYQFHHGRERAILAFGPLTRVAFVAISPAVHVIKANDVILAKIGAALHLDHFEFRVTWIG